MGKVILFSYLPPNKFFSSVLFLFTGIAAEHPQRQGRHSKYQGQRNPFILNKRTQVTASHFQHSSSLAWDLRESLSEGGSNNQSMEILLKWEFFLLVATNPNCWEHSSVSDGTKFLQFYWDIIDTHGANFQSFFCHLLAVTLTIQPVSSPVNRGRECLLHRMLYDLNEIHVLITVPGLYKVLKNHSLNKYLQHAYCQTPMPPAGYAEWVRFCLDEV